MKPGGVIAFHVTNRYLDLVPVVEALADAHGLAAVQIRDETKDTLTSTQRLGAAVGRPRGAREPRTRGIRDADRAAARLAAVDRRLQQPGPGAEVTGRRWRVEFRHARSRETSPTVRDPASYRALVHPAGTRHIEALDQRALPHAVVAVKIGDADAAALAIRTMWVRGAPLIGAVGAYGLALALDRDATDAALAKAHAALDATRPTAVNLRWALDRVRDAVAPAAAVGARRRRVARGRRDRGRGRGDQPRDRRARARAAARDSRVSGPARCSVMTHCNAGALATCGWGTATAPLFLAHAEGLPVHVWVSETRPRLQGANLTAWEMARARRPAHAAAPTPRARC